MEYDHTLHAGNFEDVVKHLAVTVLLRALRRAGSPIRYIESHAGRGRYDLAAPPPTPRACASGIESLWLYGRSDAALTDLMGAVAELNPADGPPRFYPGSPRIARRMLGPADGMSLMELQPEVCAALAAEFASDPQVAVHCADARCALSASLPPPAARGLLLLDPPYVRAGEFDDALRLLREARRAWPAGTIALWYPADTRPDSAALAAALKAFVPQPVLFEASRDRGTRKGCGMAIFCAPAGAGAELSATLARMCEILAGAGAQRPCLQWM